MRFKIVMAVLLTLVGVLTVTSWLRYSSYRRLLVETLELSPGSGDALLGDSPIAAVDSLMSAYVRSRILLSASPMVAILIIVNLMMGRLVVNRLQQLLGAVERVSQDDLDARVTISGHDEITELERAFNQMAGGLEAGTGAKGKRADAAATDTG